MSELNFWEVIRRIRRQDDRFKEGLYPFLMESLEQALQRLGERRHITARELIEGMCLYARARFGPLAHDVVANWGVHSPNDVGTAVFQLVDAGVLSRRESDRIEDFDIDVDLRQVLESGHFE